MSVLFNNSELKVQISIKRKWGTGNMNFFQYKITLTSSSLGDSEKMLWDLFITGNLLDRPIALLNLTPVKLTLT